MLQGDATWPSDEDYFIHSTQHWLCCSLHRSRTLPLAESALACQSSDAHLALARPPANAARAVTSSVCASQMHTFVLHAALCDASTPCSRPGASWRQLLGRASSVLPDKWHRPDYTQLLYQLSISFGQSCSSHGTFISAWTQLRARLHGSTAPDSCARCEGCSNCHH